MGSSRLVGLLVASAIVAASVAAPAAFKLGSAAHHRRVLHAAESLALSCRR